MIIWRGANNFLKEYLPKYNCIFAIPAANPKNLHKPVPADMDLAWVFALREERIISKDFLVAWNNRAFLLAKPSMALIKAKVTVLENLQGEIRIWLNNRYLEFTEITAGTLRQIRTKKQSSGKTAVKLSYKIWKPPADHPWRRKWSCSTGAAE